MSMKLTTIALLALCLVSQAADSSLNHWSVQAVKAPAEGTTIDSLIAAKLRSNGLSMSPQADARTLIRRLSFDLTGLPPKPEEVTEFTKHTTDFDQAYEQLVDRLLASPHYGERWGAALAGHCSLR